MKCVETYKFKYHSWHLSENSINNLLLSLNFRLIYPNGSDLLKLR
jgi:hypothetical protein